VVFSQHEVRAADSGQVGAGRPLRLAGLMREEGLT
jgi:hypothetical protein